MFLKSKSESRHGRSYLQNLQYKYKYPSRTHTRARLERSNPGTMNNLYKSVKKKKKKRHVSNAAVTGSQREPRGRAQGRPLLPASRELAQASLSRGGAAPGRSTLRPGVAVSLEGEARASPLPAGSCRAPHTRGTTACERGKPWTPARRGLGAWWAARSPRRTARPGHAAGEVSGARGAGRGARGGRTWGPQAGDFPRGSQAQNLRM